MLKAKLVDVHSKGGRMNQENIVKIRHIIEESIDEEGIPEEYDSMLCAII